jgi:hypothetical protein
MKWYWANALLYQPQMIDDCGTIGGMRIAGKIEVL